MIPVPALDADTASAEQRGVLAEILAARGRRLGDPPGPFGPLLNSPEGARAVAAVGAYCRYATSLERELVEAVTVAVAHACASAYELAQHEPLARAAGLDDDQLAAIREHRLDSPALPARMRLALAVADDVARGTPVPDDLGERALSVLGERAVTEVAIVAAYYLMLARLIATFPEPR